MTRLVSRVACLSLGVALGLLSPAVAWSDTARWEELGRAAIRAVERQQYGEAEQFLQQALQEATDLPRAQALTLQALIRLSVAQRRANEVRGYARQLIDLGEAFRQPGYRDMAERYRGSARALRLLGLEDDAAGLDTVARRIELPVGTACGDRLESGKRAHPLSAAQRGKAEHAVDALETLTEWTGGSQPKDRVEYAGRLAKVEALAGDYLTGVGDDRDQPTRGIKEALTCFQEAAQAWPRVTQP